MPRLTVSSRLDARTERNRAPSSVLVNNAALHYKYNAPNGCDVLQRISIERNDIRLQAGGDRANLIAQA